MTPHLYVLHGFEWSRQSTFALHKSKTVSATRLINVLAPRCLNTRRLCTSAHKKKKIETSFRSGQIARPEVACV